jgi:hypothetical protein
MRASFLRVGALCAVATMGCEEADAPNAALRAHLAEHEAAGRFAPLAPDHLKTPAQLVAVLKRPLRRGLDHLVGSELTLTGTYTLTFAGDTEVRLAEAVALQIDGEGAFALAQTQDAATRGEAPQASGRRCGRVGGAAYTGGRFGPVTRIDVRADEAERCLAGAIDPLVSLLEVFADRLDVSLAGPGVIGGRPTTRIAFDLRPGSAVTPTPVPLAWPPEPTAPGAEAPPSRAVWGPREALVARHTEPGVFRGEVVLDTATGLPRSGSLEARFAVRKADRNAVLEVKIELGTAPFAGVLTFPEGARIDRPRPRIFADREALLGDDRKARTPITLPGPGDAPRLGPAGDEVETTPTVQDDEDRPEGWPAPGDTP